MKRKIKKKFFKKRFSNELISEYKKLNHQEFNFVLGRDRNLYATPKVIGGKSYVRVCYTWLELDESIY